MIDLLCCIARRIYIFHLIDAGYIGEHLAKIAREVKTRWIQVRPEVVDYASDSNKNEENTSSERKVPR